jgi:hypothetical protein
MSEETVASSSIPARKQLAILVQFIVLVFIAAIFFRFRIVESIRHTEDFEAIAVLASFADSPVHKVLAQANQYDSKDDFRQAFDLSIQDAFMIWLRKYHSNIDDLHRRARQSLAEWLNENGFSQYLSGKGVGQRESFLPFLPFRSSMPLFDSPIKDEPESSAKTTRIYGNPSIIHLLEEIRHLSSPTTFSIATGFRDPTLPTLGFSRSENRLDSIVLADNANLLVTFLVHTERPGQTSPQHRVISIPVVTETIKEVDLLLMLAESQDQRKRGVPRLNKDAFENLLLTYGRLQLDQGKQISGQRMLDSYQDVDMLGFKLSPRHFWLFVFTFHAVFLSVSIVHIRSPNGRHEQETMTFATNILIENKLIRILVWCLLPMLSMLLTYPRAPWPLFTAVVYWGAIAILVALGIKVYFLANAAEASHGA